MNHRVRWTVSVLALAALGACADEGPVSGPGVLTATLRSPNGPEGAAVIVLLGDNVGEVSAAGGTEVHSLAGDSLVRVVLIDVDGGDLAFQVAVADTTKPVQWVIHEVAGPGDALRSPLVGYSLEFRR